MYMNCDGTDSIYMRGYEILRFLRCDFCEDVVCELYMCYSFLCGELVRCAGPYLSRCEYF